MHVCLFREAHAREKFRTQYTVIQEQEHERSLISRFYTLVLKLLQDYILAHSRK